MYVGREAWSTPDATDPPPCFRQGDVAFLKYAQVQLSTPTGPTLENVTLETRREPVALLCSCCDLVVHEKQKRKGFLFSPLRNVPKDIAKDPEKLAALKMGAVDAREKGVRVPFNLFFYAEFQTTVGGEEKTFGDQVIYLECIQFAPMAALRGATKLAELSDQARVELQERLKAHFAR